MAADEHKSIKDIDRELAEKAEALEQAIEQAEAKHSSLGGGAPNEADDDGKPSA